MTEKHMPVLFVGHGNPMNAIEENEFVDGFRNIVKERLQYFCKILFRQYL